MQYTGRAPQRNAPGILPWKNRNVNGRCFDHPTPESRCVPRTSAGDPLRDIGAPHNIQAQQTNRIFQSKGTNPTSPVQPMALVRAPNSLWRKSLPLTFTLCSPTQFSIVLPEWLLGFREKKRLCYTLLRASQSLHDFCRPPSLPGYFLPSSPVIPVVWGSRGYLDLASPSASDNCKNLSLLFFSIPQIFLPCPLSTTGYAP